MGVRTRSVLALAILVFLPAAIFAQDSLWKAYTDAGTKAYEAGRYSEAERRFRLACEEAESFGSQDRRLALSHYNLAVAYLKQEKVAETLEHSGQALAIWEKIRWEAKPRTESLQVADNLESLAAALLGTKEYTHIEHLLKLALTIKEGVLRPKHPTLSVTLGYLAITNFLQKNQADADSRCEQALAFYKNPDEAARYSDIIQAFRNCALINQYRENYAKAEEFLKSALEFRKKNREPEYTDSDTLDALASLYRRQSKYKEAESALRRRLEIIERAYGLNDSHTALALNDLADVFIAQDDYATAGSVYQEALANLEKVSGDTRATKLKMVDGLSSVYYALKEYPATESWLQQCLAIAAEIAGTESPLYASYLNFQGSLFLDQEKFMEAQPIFRRALDIREKVLPPDSADIAQSLNNLAKDYYFQDKFGDADPLYLRAINISQKHQAEAPGDLAWYTKNYALLLYAQGKNTLAESRLREAFDLFPKSQRESSEAFTSYELAELYRRQKKYDDSEIRFKQALTLMEQIKGYDRYQFVKTLERYAKLLRDVNRIDEAKRLEERAIGMRSKK